MPLVKDPPFVTSAVRGLTRGLPEPVHVLLVLQENTLDMPALPCVPAAQEARPPLLERLLVRSYKQKVLAERKSDRAILALCLYCLGDVVWTFGMNCHCFKRQFSEILFEQKY